MQCAGRKLSGNKSAFRRWTFCEWNLKSNQFTWVMDNAIHEFISIILLKYSSERAKKKMPIKTFKARIEVSDVVLTLLKLNFGCAHTNTHKRSFFHSFRWFDLNFCLSFSSLRVPWMNCARSMPMSSHVDNRESERMCVRCFLSSLFRLTFVSFVREPPTRCSPN